jgi:hypothetical protein
LARPRLHRCLERCSSCQPTGRDGCLSRAVLQSYGACDRWSWRFSFS